MQLIHPLQSSVLLINRLYMVYHSCSRSVGKSKNPGGEGRRGVIELIQCRWEEKILHIFLSKSGGEGTIPAPPVATALCSILLISIRLSSFDLLYFGTNFRGYIRTCFPITNNLFLFFNFYARIDQIIKEVFT